MKDASRYSSSCLRCFARHKYRRSQLSIHLFQWAPSLCRTPRGRVPCRRAPSGECPATARPVIACPSAELADRLQSARSNGERPPGACFSGGRTGRRMGWEAAACSEWRGRIGGGWWRWGKRSGGPRERCCWWPSIGEKARRCVGALACCACSVEKHGNDDLAGARMTTTPSAERPAAELPRRAPLGRSSPAGCHGVRCRADQVGREARGMGGNEE